MRLEKKRCAIVIKMRRCLTKITTYFNFCRFKKSNRKLNSTLNKFPFISNMKMVFRLARTIYEITFFLCGRFCDLRLGTNNDRNILDLFIGQNEVSSYKTVNSCYNF